LNERVEKRREDWKSENEIYSYSKLVVLAKNLILEFCCISLLNITTFSGFYE